MEQSIPPAGPGGRAALRPLDEVLQELLAQVDTETLETQTVSSFAADARVLAHDVLAELAVPAHDNSAMDGYAVRAAELLAAPAGVFEVSQRIAAGPAQALPLAAGTVARIFTGALLPAGADAVVPQEDCLPLADGRLRFLVQPKTGQHIRRAGEDIRLGQVVLPRGRRLTAADIGLAASIGLAELKVRRRPRVALLSTGDELAMPGQVAPSQLPPGGVFNSNRFFLHALLSRLGCEITDLGIVPDSLDATCTVLAQAAQTHDVIISSGGVSVGEEDHVKPAVQALGQLLLWQVAIKPGKPFAYGQLRRGSAEAGAATHFIGLPGNPVSSYVSCLLLLRPFLLRLQGVTDVLPRPLAAIVDFDWRKVDHKRREFLRVRVQADGRLALFGHQGSGVLTSVAWADGLIDLQPGQALQTGDPVRYLPFAELSA
jgi:molybdopterin molybdotransferase